MQKKISLQQASKSLTIVFLYLAIFLSFVVAYKLSVFDVFIYDGFIYDYKISRVFLSGIIIIIFASILSFATEQLSHIFLHVLFVLVIIPMMLIYCVAGGEPTYFFVSIVSFALVIIVTLTPIAIPKIRQISLFAVLPLRMSMWLFLFVGLLYILVVIYYGGLKFLNFDIWKIYEFRRAASENLPSYFNYFTPIVSKAVTPILLALALINKNWFVGIFAIVLSIFIFATAGHKVTLIMSIAVIGFYILLSSKYRLYLLLAFQIVIALTSIYSPIIGDKNFVFSNLIFRRIYVVPAQINYEYYNFFSINEKVKWSNSRISLGLLEYPYELSVPYLIGDKQYSMPERNVNTGWLGTGYSHFGFLGMLLYAFLMGLFIRFTDVLLRKTTLAFAGSVFIVPYLSLFTSSDIPTMFLTHGLMFVFIFVFFLANKKIIL